MAAAFALITSLLNTLEFHFLQPLPCLIYDDREMIESLCKKLGFLQAFLEDSGKKSSKRQQARRVLETEIRGVALDAEGKVESKLRQVYLCGNEDVEHRLKAWSLHETLQQVMRDIESIEWRIQIESNNNHSVELRRTNTIENIKAGSFSKSSSQPKNVIVGCEDEFNTILLKLHSNSKKTEVISIVGMGGIGKTTLVRRVYENANIISHFDVRAWCTVSQKYNFRKMLLDLLDCIVIKRKRSTDEEDISNDPPAIDTIEGDISDDHPKSQLRKELMGKRYLIVIDDIWSIEAWDDIYRCFPEEDLNGSRILLTTQLRQVADYVGGSGKKPHYMRFLNSDESWNLFYKKVFEEKKFPLEFERVGRAIVEKCHGLPLTIIVVAGLLTSINKSSINNWGIVTENLNSLLNMDPQEKCSKILSLSYHHLPPHLKVCFLYFGVFPEDSKIVVKKLIQLWVAEGFLKLESNNKTMEEVAESYLQDLIDRCLVQIDSWSSSGKIKSCKLHDVLHSFCLREAQRENLLHVINNTNNVEVGRVDESITMSTSLDPKACRWISNQLSHLHWPIALSMSETRTSNEFHSVLCFPKDVVDSYNPFPCFKLLRVLDIASTAALEFIPSGIVDLVNLRYLALNTGALLQDLQWFKLRSLQTLIVCYSTSSPFPAVSPPEISWSYNDASSFRGSPLDILDLPRLRHVHFTRGFSLCLPKSVQGNLRTISWLNLPHCMLSKPDFERIPNIKKLGIYIETTPVLERVMLPPGSLDALVHLPQLDNLKIEVQGVRNYPTSDFRLPVAFPSNLKKLTLNHTCLPWEDMTIIGTLCKLEVLKLIRWAFRGPKWETTDNQFCSLKHLQIEDSDLRHWFVDVGHLPFPILEHLILSDCWGLKHFPPSLADITTLQLIELSNCHDFLTTSAKKIQEDQLGYGNDELLVRQFHTRKLKKRAQDYY